MAPRSDRTVQFLGGVGDYDVFWIDSNQTLILKYSGQMGETFIYADGVWRAHTMAARPLEVLTEDEREVALAMMNCFAIKS